MAKSETVVMQTAQLLVMDLEHTRAAVLNLHGTTQPMVIKSWIPDLRLSTTQ